MRQIILPIVLGSAVIASAAEFELHGSLNMDYATYFDEDFDPTNAANQDIDLSATARLDENVSATVRFNTHSTYLDKEGVEQASEVRHGLARSTAMGGEDGRFNSVDFDGAEIRWTVSSGVDLIFGDLSYSAGAFNYYFWRDPARYAVIMREESLRGIGGEFGNEKFGQGKVYVGASDNAKGTVAAYASYALPLLNHVDEHLIVTPSVDWMFGQHIGRHNTYSVGLEVDYSKSDGSLNYGAYAVWGMHPYKGSNTHSFLIEPSFNISFFNLGLSYFYAIVDDEYDVEEQLFTDDQMLFAVEPSFDLNKKLSLGVTYEFHDHNVDEDDEYSFLGLNFYAYPTLRTEVVVWCGYNFREEIRKGEKESVKEAAFGVSGRADF